jgi:hypothetical protein
MMVVMAAIGRQQKDAGNVDDQAYDRDPDGFGKGDVGGLEQTPQLFPGDAERDHAQHQR